VTTAKKRILIIDDEIAMTRLLRLNLHHTGRYLAQTVNDAAEAVVAASAFSPDVILLDVMMPGMDGGDVAGKLRRVPELKDVPIVFLTATVTPGEVASHLGRIGGLDFIAKPVCLAELVQRIEKVCAN